MWISRLVHRAAFVSASLSVLLLAVAPSQAKAQDHSPAQHEVVLLLERVASLMQAGDLTALDEVYAPGRGVHIIEGAGVNHGWAEYRDHHLAPELAAFENFSYRWFAIEPVVSGDMAFAAFQYELDADTPDGHVATRGRGTVVLRRMEGAWKIVHSHTSGRRVPGGGV